MSDNTSPLPGGSTSEHRREDQTMAWPSSDAPSGSTPPGGAQPQAAPADGVADSGKPEAQWITGPSAPTLLAGLLTLVIAALAIIRLSTDVAIDWSIAAPVTVIAVGVIAVVLGAASFSRRARSAEHETTD